jgi:hypothetical protein
LCLNQASLGVLFHLGSRLLLELAAAYFSSIRIPYAT